MVGGFCFEVIKLEDIERRKLRSSKEKRFAHKCYGCMWVTWIDIERATCAFGRCFREVTSQKYAKK